MQKKCSQPCKAFQSTKNNPFQVQEKNKSKERKEKTNKNESERKYLNVLFYKQFFNAIKYFRFCQAHRPVMKPHHLSAFFMNLYASAEPEREKSTMVPMPDLAEAAALEQKILRKRGIFFTLSLVLSCPVHHER